MFCRSCGSPIPDTAKFCTECGQPVAADNSMKKIQLKCRQCGGTMHASDKHRVLFCSYCGSEELVEESDAVKIETIRNETYKEIEHKKIETYRELEHEKLAALNEKRREARMEQDVRKYKKGLLSKITFLMILICAVCAYDNLERYDYLLFLISSAQTVLFTLSWMIGRNIINVKKYKRYKLFAFLGFIFIIVYIGTASTDVIWKDRSKDMIWPDTDLTGLIPTPASTKGNILIANDEALIAEVYHVSEQDFSDYKARCKEMGFIYDSNQDLNYFTGRTKEWYELILYYSKNEKEMSINFDIRDELGPLTWPVSDLAELIPVPSSDCGSTSYESSDYFSIYVGNTTFEEYNNYVKACSDCGFSVNYTRGKDYYRADHKDGYHISLSYYDGDVMEIYLKTVEK